MTSFFWGPTKPGIQKVGGLSWWAELNYAFKIQMALNVGMAASAKSVGAVGISIPLSVNMDGHGVSNAAFNISIPLSVGMTRRPPEGPYGFGIPIPLSVQMQAKELYARAFNISIPLSIGMAPTSISGPSPFGISLPLSVDMQGTFVPLDPIFVGGAAAGANTVAVPAGHQSGDLIIYYAFRDGNATAPTLPAGWTALYSGGSNTCAAVCVYKWAASNAEAAPTFTNATATEVVVYRNVLGIGNGNFIGGSSATVNYGPVSAADIDTNKMPWYVAFGAHRSVNATMNVAPAGMTNRVVLEGASTSIGDLAAFDTNGSYSATNWPSTNVTTTETSSGYLTVVLELIPLNVASIQNTSLTNIPVPQGKSARIRARGAGASGGSANRPSSGGWGGGGGGGGAYVDITIPAAQLGPTFSMQQGFGGTAPAANSATNGNDGQDSFFSSNGLQVTAGGGKAGVAGGSGASTGGAGGTVTNGFATAPTVSENGSAGANGSRTAGAVPAAPASTTNAGPGGGGGGCNSSTASNGGPGGSSASETGGAGGVTNGGSGTAPADLGPPNPGAGGGGGAGGSGFGSNAGNGAPGTQGAGGGGAGGKEGSSGNGGQGLTGGIGYVRVDFV